MTAFLVRIIATLLVLAFLALFLFLSGRILFAPDEPGFGRHQLVDWGCPQCDNWGTAYVSRFWRARARRRAIGLVHRRLAPQCNASDAELVVLS